MQDNPVRQHQRKEFQRRMNNLQGEFSRIDQGNINNVLEAIFVRDFLPLFSGEDMDNKEVLLSYWYLIAGTPYHPVNVVSPSGEFIIQIPPVLDRTTVVSSPTKEMELGTVFEHAKQKAYLSPGLGERMISGALNQRLLKHTKESVSAELSEKWEAVLKHYGKRTSAVATAANKQSAGESDFEIE